MKSMPHTIAFRLTDLVSKSGALTATLMRLNPKVCDHEVALLSQIQGLLVLSADWGTDVSFG